MENTTDKTHQNETPASSAKYNTGNFAAAFWKKRWHGRASQTECIQSTAATAVVFGLLALWKYSVPPMDRFIPGLAAMIAAALVIIPSWYLWSRRLHDAGVSGKWILAWVPAAMALVPLTGAHDCNTVYVSFYWATAALMCILPGDTKSNRYGEPTSAE